MKASAIAAAAALILTVIQATVARAQTSVNVQFASGANSATMTGRIQGYTYRDYVVNARAGQRMEINLQTQHTATYFNLMAPGSSEAAMYIGSVNGNSFRGRLDSSGDYRIRVYMMRSAARRDEVAGYRLTVSVAGGTSGAAPDAPGSVGISDLKGMDAIKAFDAMIARGFKNVDSMTSANTIYGIYYQPRTHQCVQLTNADGRVFDARDIEHHPKCK